MKVATVLIIVLGLLMPSSASANPTAGSEYGDRIVFDLSLQRVWLVNESQGWTKTYLVSGSRFDYHHRPGVYKVFSKSLKTTSYLGNATMNYMVRFDRGKRANIGFHDIPKYFDGSYAQTESQLGTALSDGCVRQRSSNAKALYEFAKIGTAVIVIP
jgi:lipoprotein-anchoring transpeptidase ErfK/SrfK